MSIQLGFHCRHSTEAAQVKVTNDRLMTADSLMPILIPPDFKNIYIPANCDTADVLLIGSKNPPSEKLTVSPSPTAPLLPPSRHVRSLGVIFDTLSFPHPCLHHPCPHSGNLPPGPTSPEHLLTIASPQLHWFPVPHCITYKTPLITFKALQNLTPPYLTEPLHINAPSPTLGSASASPSPAPELPPAGRRWHWHIFFTCSNKHTHPDPPQSISTSFSFF